MNHKHRPNLEKLIKNASEILKVKPEISHTQVPITVDLAFIRRRERHFPSNMIAQFGTPRHRRNLSHKSNKLSLSPVSSTPNFKLSSAGKEEQNGKVRDLISSIEGFQIENKMFHRQGLVGTDRIRQKVNIDQMRIMSKFRKTVCKANRNSA